MGYTHYWHRKPTLNQAAFEAAVQDCRKLCAESPIAIAGCDGHGAPEFDPDSICFNGVTDESCEAFIVDRETQSDHLDEHGRYRDLCKTERRPYDLLVQCCLIILWHHLGEHFIVTSDGNAADWKRAIELCQVQLGYGQDFTLGGHDG